MACIQVRRIRILLDRADFEICIPQKRNRRTDADLARRVLGIRPDLGRHACVNDKGNTFSAVLAETSVPHLIEHCAISFLIESSENPDAVYEGTSEWVDQSCGLARISLSMDDDLAVLRAFNSAVELLESLLENQACPTK